MKHDLSTFKPGGKVRLTDRSTVSVVAVRADYLIARNDGGMLFHVFPEMIAALPHDSVRMLRSYAPRRPDAHDGLSDWLEIYG